ncbi:DUF7576 family protein [Halostella litorea]|uniref:DUF7576 family protein n=1 Tax=Halostella litorea TaxID=2528831 RepID=UPI001092CE94|nr:hypothetical protein [Halostella litorea]
MNADNEQENRDARPSSTPNATPGSAPSSERVVNRSIRVLLDSHSPHRCDNCGELIREGTQFRNVTVREASDELTDYSFCTEECLSATNV